MLKFIDRIAVSFPPLHANARSARAFLSVMNTEKNTGSNPKCRLETTISDKVSDPFVEVLYSDQKRIRILTRHLHSHEIVKDIEKHSRFLQLEEDIKSQK